MIDEKEFMYENLHRYKRDSTVPVYIVEDGRNSQKFITTFDWDRAWAKYIEMYSTHYPHITLLEVENDRAS